MEYQKIDKETGSISEFSALDLFIELYELKTDIHLAYLDYVQIENGVIFNTPSFQLRPQGLDPKVSPCGHLYEFVWIPTGKCDYPLHQCQPCPNDLCMYFGCNHCDGEGCQEYKPCNYQVEVTIK